MELAISVQRSAISKDEMQIKPFIFSWKLKGEKIAVSYQQRENVSSSV